MPALIPLTDDNGDSITLFLRDVRKLEFTARNSSGAAVNISSWSTVKAGVKEKIRSTTFLLQGTSVVVDDGTIELRGRFDITLDLTAAPLIALFGTTKILLIVFMELTGVDAGDDITLQQFTMPIQHDINV